MWRWPQHSQDLWNPSPCCGTKMMEILHWDLVVALKSEGTKTRKNALIQKQGCKCAKKKTHLQMTSSWKTVMLSQWANTQTLLCCIHPHQKSSDCAHPAREISPYRDGDSKGCKCRKQHLLFRRRCHCHWFLKLCAGHHEGCKSLHCPTQSIGKVCISILLMCTCFRFLMQCQSALCFTVDIAWWPFETHWTGVACKVVWRNGAHNENHTWQGALMPKVQILRLHGMHHVANCLMGPLNCGIGLWVACAIPVQTTGKAAPLRMMGTSAKSAQPQPTESIEFLFDSKLTDDLLCNTKGHFTNNWNIVFLSLQTMNNWRCGKMLEQMQGSGVPDIWTTPSSQHSLKDGAVSECLWHFCLMFCLFMLHNAQTETFAEFCDNDWNMLQPKTTTSLNLMKSGIEDTLGSQTHPLVLPTAADGFDFTGWLEPQKENNDFSFLPSKKTLLSRCFGDSRFIGACTIHSIHWYDIQHSKVTMSDTNQQLFHSLRSEPCTTGYLHHLNRQTIGSPLVVSRYWHLHLETKNH